MSRQARTTTAIEWTQTTWNPVTGCDRVSPGCRSCYALTLARRLKAMGQAKYQADGDPATSGPGFGITVHEDALWAPLTWRTPRTVFVNSMSDLFHKGVPDEFIAKVFAVMALTPRHTYQVLTKRHARMRSLLADREFRYAVYDALVDIRQRAPVVFSREQSHILDWPARNTARWPLPNIWLGTSAAVRFLSAEPLLGPVDLTPWLTGANRPDWVIIGGESGPHARPLELSWVRKIRDQCQAADVAVFIKQLGSVWARANEGRGKGGNPDAWPTDLRIRQIPAEGAT